MINGESIRLVQETGGLIIIAGVALGMIERRQEATANPGARRSEPSRTATARTTAEAGPVPDESEAAAPTAYHRRDRHPGHLDDDQHAFEDALVARLVAYRESVEADAGDPAPRSLLPLGTLALACLAVQVHGWELGVRSGYLPYGLLGPTDAPRRAAQGNRNNLGCWAAK